MNDLPEGEWAWVVRTDFSHDAAWHSLCAAIREPAAPFRAKVAHLSEPANDGLPPERVQSVLPGDTLHSFVFVVDRTALAHADHPILVIDLYDQPGRTFRVVPSEMATVENNLSIANMDFDDFLKALDEDGVFRGFR